MIADISTRFVTEIHKSALCYGYLVLYFTTTLTTQMEPIMKPTRKILALFIAVWTLPMAAAGQAGETSTATASNNETIDNIVVTGQKSLGDLRRDVFQAEEEFYEVFNSLNDEKDYTVRCFYERATGTNIKNHVCRARFVTKAYSAHAGRNGNDLSRVANQSTNPAFVEKTAKYQEKMETLIAANPELQEALIRYNTVRAQFVEQREGS